IRSHHSIAAPACALPQASAGHRSPSPVARRGTCAGHSPPPADVAPTHAALSHAGPVSVTGFPATDSLPAWQSAPGYSRTPDFPAGAFHGPVAVAAGKG